MFRLHEAGKSAREIAELCEDGRAGPEPFAIPRRTAAEIVNGMAAAAEAKLPRSIEEVESVEAVERFSARILGIVDAELTRLEAKPRLSLQDIDRLNKASELTYGLEKRLRRRGGTGGAKRSRQAPEKGTASERALADLAKELGSESGAESDPSDTHSRQSPDDRKPTPAPEPSPDTPLTPPPAALQEADPVPGDAPEPAAAPMPTDDAIAASLAEKTPAERADIRHRAQAALGLAR
jgi:hypothetical protein